MSEWPALWQVPCSYDLLRWTPWPLLGRHATAPPMDWVRKQGTSPRGPSSYFFCVHKQWRLRPCGSLPLLRKAPELGRAHRVFECTLNVYNGPKQTGSAPECMTRKTPSPVLPSCGPCIRSLALAANVGPHDQMVQVWRGSCGSQSPTSARQETTARPATGS